VKLFTASGTAAVRLFIQVSNDFGVGDDEGVDRVNSNNIITNWVLIVNDQ
jgi:hypothetical protein